MVRGNKGRLREKEGRGWGRSDFEGGMSARNEGRVRDFVWERVVRGNKGMREKKVEGVGERVLEDTTNFDGYNGRRMTKEFRGKMRGMRPLGEGK